MNRGAGGFFCELQEIWHGVDRSTFISVPFIRGDVTDFCSLSHTGVCSDIDVRPDAGVALFIPTLSSDVV